jgi:hypothetical protein
MIKAPLRLFSVGLLDHLKRTIPSVHILGAVALYRKE